MTLLRPKVDVDAVALSPVKVQSVLFAPSGLQLGDDALHFMAACVIGDQQSLRRFDNSEIVHHHETEE